MRTILFMLSLLPSFFGSHLFAENISSLHDNYKNLLENTIWVVPPSTLLAYAYEGDTVAPVVDQTVWIINTYEGGYFFGTAYTLLDGVPSSVKNLLGTLTNSGDVYISFYSGSSTSSDLVNGIGTFKKVQGAYQFTMQMNAGSSTNGVSHWSYMVNAPQGSPYYESLPGYNLSLPEFLSLFEPI